MAAFCSTCCASWRRNAAAVVTTAIEGIGWAAALLILASYLLVSTGKLSGQSAAFQWMNLVGAAGFVLNSGWHGAWPSTTLNVAWAAIGIVTLLRLWRSARLGA